VAGVIFELSTDCIRLVPGQYCGRQHLRHHHNQLLAAAADAAAGVMLF